MPGLVGSKNRREPTPETQTAYEEQPEDLLQLPSEQLLLDEEEHEQRMVEKAETTKKQQMWNNERTAKLGSNPKEYRKQLRDSVDQGFYVPVSSMGQCYLLPTVDYTTFSFLGPRLPSRNLYDQTCKWCAKSGDMNQEPRFQRLRDRHVLIDR